LIAREKSSADVHRDEVGALPKRRCVSQPRAILAGLLATAIEKRRGDRLPLQQRIDSSGD
jgi:hypothetical protein